MTPTVDDYVRAAMSAFRAERGSRTIHAGGRTMTVRTPAERILHLPNGQHVRVSVDDSGVATQVEEDEALHAIVRPHTIRRKLAAISPETAATVSATVAAIRTRTTPRSPA